MNSAFSLLAIAILSFGLGLFRDISIAVNFGTKVETDILFFSLIVPVFLENLLGVALRDAVIPYFQYQRGISHKSLNQSALKLAFIVVVFSSLLSATLISSSSFWVSILAPGWEVAVNAQASALFEWAALLVPIVTLGYVLTAYLNVKGRLVVSAWRSVFFNIGGLLGVWCVGQSIQAVLVGFVVFQFIHLCWMLIVCFKNDVGYQYSARKQNIKPVLFSLGFVLLSVSVLQLNVIFERFFASWLEAGSISALSYAYRIVTAPVTLLTFSIIAVAYPKISGLVYAERGRELKGLIVYMVSLFLLILGPTGLLLFFKSEEIIGIIFGYGVFDEKAVELTSDAVKGYAVGVLPIGLALFASRICIALEAFVVLAGSAVAAAITTVLLDYLLVDQYGVFGLALAFSVGAMIQLGVIGVRLREFGLKFKMGVGFYSNVIVTLAGSIVLNIWTWNEAEGLVVLGLIIFSMYFFVYLAFNKKRLHLIKRVLFC